MRAKPTSPDTSTAPCAMKSNAVEDTSLHANQARGLHHDPNHRVRHHWPMHHRLRQLHIHRSRPGASASVVTPTEATAPYHGLAHARAPQGFPQPWSQRNQARDMTHAAARTGSAVNRPLSGHDAEHDAHAPRQTHPGPCSFSGSRPLPSATTSRYCGLHLHFSPSPYPLWPIQMERRLNRLHAPIIPHQIHKGQSKALYFVALCLRTHKQR